MLPIVLAVPNRLGIQGWYHYHGVVKMGRAGFEDADLDIWNLGEAGSHAQSGRAAANDNEVILMLEEVVNRTQGRQVSVSHGEKAIDELSMRGPEGKTAVSGKEEATLSRTVRPHVSITRAEAGPLYT